MSRRFSLESFDARSVSQSANLEELPEEKWLEAFEKGYKDGWEDAERTLLRRQAHVSDELVQHFQDLHFTLAEAKFAVRKEMSVVLKSILETILPEQLNNILAPQILSELEELSGMASSAQIEVFVAPEQVENIRRIISIKKSDAVIVQSDLGQKLNTARINIGAQAREVDLETALAQISDAVASYFDEHTPDQYQEQMYG